MEQVKVDKKSKPAKVKKEKMLPLRKVVRMESILNRGEKQASPLSEASKRERRNLLLMCMVILTVIYTSTEKITSIKITEGVVLDNMHFLFMAIVALLVYQMLQYLISAMGDGVLDHYREMGALQRYITYRMSGKKFPYQVDIVGAYQSLCARVDDMSENKEKKEYKAALKEMRKMAKTRKRIAFLRSFILDIIFPFCVWFFTFMAVWKYNGGAMVDFTADFSWLSDLSANFPLEIPVDFDLSSIGLGGETAAPKAPTPPAQ